LLGRKKVPGTSNGIPILDGDGTVFTAKVFGNPWERSAKGRVVEVLFLKSNAMTVRRGRKLL